MSKPETVLFDLGNVLVSIHPGRFLQSLGIDLETGRARYQKRIIEIVEQYERGETKTDEYLRLLGELFDGEFDNQRLQEAMLSVIGTPILGMEKLVRSVAEHAKVGLVSNTNELHFNYCLTNVPILRAIPQYFLSYQLKALKPDEHYYERVIQELGVKPSTVLFVDDLAENVEGAATAGMIAVRFLSVSALESILKKHGMA